MTFNGFRGDLGVRYGYPRAEEEEIQKLIIHYGAIYLDQGKRGFWVLGVVRIWNFSSTFIW